MADAHLALLIAGSDAENLRQGIFQAQKVVMNCVMLACVLLPVYVFCSLVIQFWENGAEVFLLLWEPVAAVAGLSLADRYKVRADAGWLDHPLDCLHPVPWPPRR